MPNSLLQERAVRDRYAEGANRQVPELCCPVNYDPRYLEAIPEEVIARDYGCGDPSRHLNKGERVLDLGSGTGKICFIASQVVGPRGHVIGVDMTPDMLDVARRNAPLVAKRIGFSNVDFRRGRIQDLKLDLDLFESELQRHPVQNAEEWFHAEGLARNLSRDAPMIPDESIDVVVSNCVLNLVEPQIKKRLFQEIHRVLDRGGRAVISDIVSDEEVPLALQKNQDLWSGCISGAYTEDGFLKAFEDAGFYGIRILERQTEPWQIVEGIEFRSLTVEAFKGKEGPCLERRQAVIYKGPFKTVIDDDGHRLKRGQRSAVCAKTFDLYSKPPYADHFEFVEPIHSVSVEEAQPFDCNRTAPRSSRETKGLDYKVTSSSGDCSEGGCC